MVSDFQDIFDAMQHAPMRHAAIVHLPVALALLALLVLFAAILVRRCAPSIMWVALAGYLLLLVSSVFAKISGEEAEPGFNSQVSEVQAVLADHEAMGEKVWMFAAAVSVLLIASFVVKKAAVRTGLIWLAMAVGVVTAGWVSLTAHHGGTLVYKHGIGVEQPAPAVAESGAPIDASLSTDQQFFHDTIRPILADNCFRCHNPARQRRSGGLDLTTRASAMEGGIGGPVIEPGNPEESMLIMAVRWEEEDFTMPPDDDQLSDDQIAALHKWIADGAAWDE